MTDFRVVSQRLETVRLDSIHPHPENPRRGDRAVIEESIAANGFYGACVVQTSSRRILAGEHRWRAAGARGATEVPAIMVDVDDATARRILLVDNRANDLASYDDRLLRELLDHAEADGGLDGTGYEALDATPDLPSNDADLDVEEADRGLEYQIVIECDGESSRARAWCVRTLRGC